MIVKRNLDPRKVSTYVWKEVGATAAMAALVWVGVEVADLGGLALPSAILAVLGVALAIFLAFRNNSAYARWWEARSAWSGIQAWSRTFARLVVTFADSHAASEPYDADRAEAFKRTMVERQIAYGHALRLALRESESWEELRPFLAEGDLSRVLAAQQRPGAILRLQGEGIYEAMASGTLQGFDAFQLEGALAQVTTFQAVCERIKRTPLLRQYDYFTRVFLWVFLAFLPLTLVGPLAEIGVAWTVIPISATLGLVFTTIAKVGAVNEDPFENRITDVPMTAICRAIERDLLEELGRRDLPPPLLPAAGYLD